MINRILSTCVPMQEEVLYPPQWCDTSEARVPPTMDELIRSNKELEQFAFAASHDLQEPLRIISTYLQLFKRKYKGLNDKEDEMISLILNRTEQMKKLIQSTLKYARTGRGTIEFVRLDSAAVIGHALENLKVAIGESGAQITWTDCPVIMGDEIQITGLFQNLISNAIKFHKKEELPCIHISANEKDGQWLFSVQDNGIGVDQEHIHGIFEVFKRLHADSEYEGSGIGLALCKKTVEAHQGKIWAESEMGKGTTLYFTIPKREGYAQEI